MTPLDAVARGAAPAAASAVEPIRKAPRSGPAEQCRTYDVGGGPVSVRGEGPLTDAEQKMLAEIVAAAKRKAQARCAVTVQTRHFTWECLRSPHEHHPDQHVMAVQR